MKIDNRMKEYENSSKTFLLRRTPVIIRIDGKSFHSWTKGCQRPFDSNLHRCMVKLTEFLCKEIQNCVLGYTQSDEISLLLNDWGTLETEQWFRANKSKMESVSASLATGYFNSICKHINQNLAFFDSRAFNIPREEVANYFIWRQQDATRNSLQMLARSLFSHKELHGVNSQGIHDMLHSKGINWNYLATWEKRGTTVYKYERAYIIDEDMPILTQDRDYIERFL